MNYCSFLLACLLEILPGSLSDRYLAQIFIQLSFNSAPAVRKRSTSRRPASVRLSVCPTVILVYYMEMAVDVIKHFIEHVVPSF